MYEHDAFFADPVLKLYILQICECRRHTKPFLLLLDNSIVKHMYDTV